MTLKETGARIEQAGVVSLTCSYRGTAEWHVLAFVDDDAHEANGPTFADALANLAEKLPCD